MFVFSVVIFERMNWDSLLEKGLIYTINTLPFKMKQRILLFLMLIGCVSLSAENKTPAYQITGQAVEQNSGKTIPYATVTLQTDSAKTIKKISCDVSGKFTVPVNEKRKYTLNPVRIRKKIIADDP